MINGLRHVVAGDLSAEPHLLVYSSLLVHLSSTSLPHAMMAGKRSRAAFEADLQAQQSPYAFYGTPLPPLDAGIRDDGSYAPLWKQEVTDDRGRKRLHGAFTGGFSAG